MVVIRSVNEIILNLLDFFKVAQPNLDCKPGTVSRDLLIDAPANVVSLLYDELGKVSIQQSLRLVVGTDLDKLAKNFGLFRKQPIASTGVGLLTFSSITATIAINADSTITAANGFTFKVQNGLSVVTSQLNFYKSIATKYQNDLTFVGITDQYAVQVSLQATTPGSAGDIPKYSLQTANIPGVSNVTNVNPFSNGSDQEDDATFRNRILSLFSGSSVGTALGYKNAALATTGVVDAYVVSPSDPLMTRDGSIVTSDSQGNLTIVKEGTGGKVDVVILGNNLVQTTDSFIFQDKSNSNDPTSTKNDYVFGQIAVDAGKTFNQKRIADLAAGTLPTQPVESIIQVTGSESGSNFQPYSIDSLGIVSGNYQLIKDTSVYAGSPWGFDKLHWVSKTISFNEDLIKGQFNGQDATTFSGDTVIPTVQQSISITNENSKVLTSNRSLIQLFHTPAAAVTRVFNVSTGERYTVTNQNPNGTGTTNTSGVIQISGNTLPSSSDVLQVDYSWVVTFDQYSDYDGLLFTNNPRSVSDSVDWGYSNLVRYERINFARNSAGTSFSGTVSLPITSILNAYQFTEVDGYVSTVATGTFTGRLQVVISNLFTLTNTVDHVYWKNTRTELFNTAQANGLFTNSTIVVGVNIEYVTTIILPTDTKAQLGNKITVTLNSTDTYNISNSNGSFVSNQITIPAANIITTANNIILNIVYIANIQNLITTGITNIPFSRLGNGYALNNSIGFNNTYLSNITRRENQTVQTNSSNQLYVEIGLTNINATLIGSQIISVIRLSDGHELWNNDFPGTIAVNGINNNYQLIFSGFNTPVTGDRVLIIYTATDNQRSQPFTFSNAIYEGDFATLQFNPSTNVFSVPIHTFVSEGPVHFAVMEANTDVVLAHGNDGYIIGTGIQASFTSTSVNFGTITDPLNLNNITVPTFQKLRIYADGYNGIDVQNYSTFRNNSGLYDIIGYNSGSNTLTIGNDFSQIKNFQISITRVADGHELWSSAGTIDTLNNLLLFPASSAANPLDLVYITYSIIDNLRQAQTRLAINVTDQVVNTGTLSVIGTTIAQAKNVVFTSTSTTLKQNLLGAIRSALGLNSNASIPINVRLVGISKLERVTTINSASNEVLSVKTTYDVAGTTINDNTFFSKSFAQDLTLGAFDFVLPNTVNNSTNVSSQLSSGDKFRITFYYATANDQENVVFTRNGLLYTNKSFALIDKVFISSGFNQSQSAQLTVSNFSQPITGSRYTVFYNYLAPKQNERIIIQYYYNKLVSDVTFAIQNARPVTADVLAREAKAIDIDVIVNIVVTSQYLSSSALVIQNVKNQITAAINANGLGSTLDSSSLINAAFSVSGVGGVRIQQFNVAGVIGQVLSITAHNDQYFVANNITVNQVSS